MRICELVSCVCIFHFIVDYGLRKSTARYTKTIKLKEKVDLMNNAQTDLNA